MSLRIDREARITQILAETGAVVTNDHFVYTSGQHGSSYINKDAIYTNVLLTEELCEMIASVHRNLCIQTVSQPAQGGIILSTYNATSLNVRESIYVAGIFADTVTKDGKEDFEFKRGYANFITDRKVLIVEHLLTTGGSVLKMV